MANVNDTGNVEGRLERAVELIGEADCSGPDREAIEAYAGWLKRRSKPNTADTYIRAVTLSAERYDGQLVDVDAPGAVDEIISAHEAAGCTAAKSVNSHLSALRSFWRWCEGTEYGVDDYRWVELVKNVEPSEENPGVDDLDPEFVLSEAEITNLRETANSYRDKAFIEFLADTGARITLATQLKRGAIDLDSDPPRYRPNPDGKGHKDVPTKDYVLHESARHVRLYLNESHPDEHDDAPLWALLRGYDTDDRENGALSRRAARNRLSEVAEDAGIDPERARPHNLRKSAVVRMRLKHDMSWDAIQKRMEWSDTALPQMKEVYRAIENEDEIEMVASELGYDVDDGDADTGPVEMECWSCGRTVASTDDFCRGCGASTDPDTDTPQAKLGRAISQLDADDAKQLIDAVDMITDDDG